MPSRILARCHKYGGRGVAVGALLATFYHFAACLYLALSGASERVFTEKGVLGGLDALLCRHIQAVYQPLALDRPQALSGSDFWGLRLSAIFYAWLLITLALALIGGAIGLIWACRPGHQHPKGKTPTDDPAAG